MEQKKVREAKASESNRRKEKSDDTEEDAIEIEMANVEPEKGEVWRPPLRGVSKPVPTPGSVKQILEDKDRRNKEITRQIADLIKVRNKIRKSNYTDMENEVKYLAGKDVGQQKGSMKKSNNPRKQNGPRITSDI